jgi:arsenate reductase (glutaredoxin)
MDVPSAAGSGTTVPAVELEFWHNPHCSKNRAAKQILDERGVAYVERRYVDHPPTAEELDRVLTALGMEPWEVARRGEAVAKELGLDGWPHDRARWIEAMVAHPILIERPILTTDDGRAVLGRPPEVVDTLL